MVQKSKTEQKEDPSHWLAKYCMTNHSLPPAPLASGVSLAADAVAPATSGDCMPPSGNSIS
jgi:hypothetical protein